MAVRLWRTGSADTEITKDLYVKKIDQSENLLYLLIYELLKGNRVYYIIFFFKGFTLMKTKVIIVSCKLIMILVYRFVAQVSS